MSSDVTPFIVDENTGNLGRTWLTPWLSVKLEPGSGADEGYR